MARVRDIAAGEASARSPCKPVCVVIVTYNSAAVLPGLLDSLPEGLAGIGDFQVIVVDNQSRDGSPEIAAAHPLAPTVVRTGSNAGYAAGINAAAAATTRDAYLLVLNPDIRLTKGAVRPLLEAAARPGTGIALPLNLHDDGQIDPTIRREPSIATAWSDGMLGGRLAARLGLGEIVSATGRYQRPGPVDWATASALMIAPEARAAVGTWDESYFLYSEEVDYQRRVRAAGFSIVFEPASVVTHIGGEYRINPRLYALLTTNRIRYFRRNHGAVATLAFRLGVAAGEVLRAWRSPVHRKAAACSLRPLRSAYAFRTDG